MMTTQQHDLENSIAHNLIISKGHNIPSPLVILSEMELLLLFSSKFSSLSTFFPNDNAYYAYSGSDIPRI